MPRDLFTLALGAAAILLVAGQLRAGEATCLTREELVARLAADYGETRRAIGLSAPDRLVELFVSDATGSWTIAQTDATGRSCLLAFGDHFAAVPELGNTGNAL